MSRFAIQTLLTFDSSQPSFGLIEYREPESRGSLVAQLFTLEDAITEAHARAGRQPQLTVIEGRKPKSVIEQ